MRKFYIILFLLGLSSAVFSQFYAKEVGMRGGYTSGITFRVNLEEDLSYEAQLAYRDNGGIFTMIRQQHLEMGMDRLGNWEFIYGFGAHAGFYLTDTYRIFFREVYFGREIFTPVFGMDGYVGIDYELVDVPMSFGVSFQPFMEISLKQIFGINLWDFGFSVRYRF
ncbi:MAG: hypothetical protein E4H10_15735 [Bacteroidia bacterium]|nr:MAG: hypothetical protein E4H10_15735 [Bacteroidia bacterium]